MKYNGEPALQVVSTMGNLHYKWYEKFNFEPRLPIITRILNEAKHNPFINYALGSS